MPVFVSLNIISVRVLYPSNVTAPSDYFYVALLGKVVTEGGGSSNYLGKYLFVNIKNNLSNYQFVLSNTVT